MSVRVMADVWERSTAKGTTRLVLLALADEASDEGEVSAYRRSHTHLARKCGCSPDTVRRAIRELVGLGELVVTETGSGRVQSSYRVTIEGVQSAPPPADRGVADRDPRGGSPAHPGVADCTPRGRADATPIIPFSPGVPRSDPKPSAPHGAGSPADVLARSVWDASNPRPATPFIAVRKIAGVLLDAGWPADAIERAMLDAPTISTRAVEFALNRGGKRQHRIDDDRGGPHGKVDAL